MLESNPFAAISATIPPAWMQAYVLAMAALVIAGTLADIVHKGSARFFFDSLRTSRGRAQRALGGGEVMGLVVKTAVVDVMTSGEFCNPRRRVAHLLTMYGFVIYLVTTVIMVFDGAAAGLVATLWWLGAAMVVVGGGWFWLFIRADVAAEGQSPLRVMRADLFVLSLLASVSLALAWAALQAAGSASAMAVFGLYLLASTVLFGGVPWSKFAHMFFKPAAAFEKRMSEANGTHANLPTLTRDDPAQRERHSMELLRNAPMDMGLGIKREPPRHY